MLLTANVSLFANMSISLNLCYIIPDTIHPQRTELVISDFQLIKMHCDKRLE